MTKSQLCVKLKMYPEHYINRCKQQKTTTAIRFNLLLVYPSEPPFVFVVSFITSSRFLSGYFNVSLNSAAFPSVGIFINFVTQLL